MPVIRDKNGNIIEVPTQKAQPAEDNANTFKVPRLPAGSDTQRLGAQAAAGGEKTVIYRGAIPGVPAEVPATAGWLVVIEGPGRGLVFEVGYGVNTLGRGPGNRIRLDFGDNQISSENQCFVTFDPDDGGFYVAGGTGVNLTKHNGRPVSAANADLADRDQIRFGETTLMFVALCNKEFRW